MDSLSNSKVSLGLLVLRVGAGLALATHGYPKLFGGEGKQAPGWMVRVVGKNFPAAVERSGPANFRKSMERMEIPAPQAAAYLSALAEFGGGLALALGFATRLVAPAIVFNMGVAIRKAHWSTGLHGQGGFEMAGLYAVIASALCLTGPGRYSIDHLLSGKGDEHARSA
ncbi:MAG TPA: DoxX family protein [Thermomicrobiaceae bacterium]|nr:DoxX family protein [Thermomicrobiaceae bacterium]